MRKRAFRAATTPPDGEIERTAALAMDMSWVAGSWFGGAARSGEGFLIDVLEGGQAFVAWFTYGDAGSE